MHIHVKVHVDGEWTDAGYEGGHTCHTGQLFFDEKSVLLTAEVEPYSTNTTTRTTLDEDTIYPGNGHEGGLLYLKYDRKRIAKGVHAHLTMGVAPDETHDNTSLTVQRSASASGDRRMHERAPGTQEGESRAPSRAAVPRQVSYRPSHGSLKPRWSG